MNSGLNPDLADHNEKPGFIRKHYLSVKQVAVTTLYFKSDWDKSVVKRRSVEEDDNLGGFATGNAKVW